MNKKLLLVVLVFLMLAVVVPGFCAEPVVSNEVSPEKIKDIAIKAVKAQGFELAEVDIVYDQGGKIWCEKAGFVGFEDKSPNHGILKHGFLKNYYIVYFDFKAPIKDIWVFIDKDTGNVLKVYREE